MNSPAENPTALRQRHAAEWRALADEAHANAQALLHLAAELRRRADYWLDGPEPPTPTQPTHENPNQKDPTRAR